MNSHSCIRICSWCKAKRNREQFSCDLTLGEPLALSQFSFEFYGGYFHMSPGLQLSTLANEEIKTVQNKSYG